MDISIIVPVYNSETTIDRLMKCFLEQVNCQNISYEILLINDGSSDNSLLKCQQYESQYENVRVFSQQNKGPSAARNVGIKNACGNKIMFCDADDFLEPDSLNYLFNSYIESDLLIFGLFDEYYDKSGTLDSCKKWSTPQKEYQTNLDFLNDFHYLLTNNLLYSQCTKMYCKKIIDDNNILFDETLSMGEDISFNLQYFQFVNKAVVLSKCIYHYVHITSSSSVSSVYFHGYFENVTAVYHKKCALLQKAGAFTNENKQAIDNYFIGRISSAIQNELANTTLKKNSQKLNAIKQIITSDIALTVAQNSKCESAFYAILEKYISRHRIKSTLCLFKILKFIKTSNFGVIKKIKNKLS